MRKSVINLYRSCLKLWIKTLVRETVVYFLIVALEYHLSDSCRETVISFLENRSAIILILFS